MEYHPSKEAQLIRQNFKDYYAHGLKVPTSLHMREFGFGFEKKIDFRHKAFSSEIELKSFIEREVPLFMSYSAAYYRYPAAQPMGKKEYLGADLIFDLDANTDHENHSKIYCKYCLDTVKQDTIRLIVEFLLGDFGFSEDEITINFSGQKGYHVHLEDKKFRSLTQEGRKQMLNYITAGDVNLESILVRQQIGYGKHVLKGPDKKSSGWAKKIFDGAYKFITNATEEDLMHFGLRKKDAKEVFEKKAHVLEKMANGNWDMLKGMDRLWENLLKESITLRSVNVDRNVTFDLARLIRLPDSLHGDTGYIAKTLKLSDMKYFDPTRDAIAFKGKPIYLKNTSAIVFDFAGEHYDLRDGEERDFPSSLAILLLCKKQAVIP